MPRLFRPRAKRNPPHQPDELVNIKRLDHHGVSRYELFVLLRLSVPREHDDGHSEARAHASNVLFTASIE